MVVHFKTLNILRPKFYLIFYDQKVLISKNLSFPKPQPTSELDAYLSFVAHFNPTEAERENFRESPLRFWKKYSYKFPGLAKLSKQIFSIPAASTSSERIFSRMKLILQGNRSAKDSESVDQELFIGSYLRGLRS